MAANIPEAAQSRDSLATMKEVEPSPVSSPEESSKQGSSYFSQRSSAITPSSGSSTSFLGLRNHGPVYYLSRIQKYSSYTFTIFTALHLTNTSLIPLIARSVPTSSTYLLLTRPYYQSFPLEPLLIGIPLLAHITSGLALRLYRRHQAVVRAGAESRDERKRIPWPYLSYISISGLISAPLVLGHAFATRGTPKRILGSSASIGLEYVSHAFARHPAVSYVGFSALICAVSAHVVWGWAKWLGLAPASVMQGRLVSAQEKKKRWWVVNGVAAGLAGLWMAGALGVVARGGEVTGWMGREYDKLYESIPVVGRWFARSPDRWQMPAWNYRNY